MHRIATGRAVAANFGFACPSRMLVLWGFTLVLIAVLAMNATAGSSGLKVSGAWVRHAPPGMMVHAAYLDIENEGTGEVSLIAASSPKYENVELHVSSVVDGIATMEKLAQVDIGKGQTVSMMPGGLHLMLMKPKGKSAVGDRIPLKLSFSDGSSLDVTAMVMSGGGAKSAHNDHANHGQMHHGH